MPWRAIIPTWTARARLRACPPPSGARPSTTLTTAGRTTRSSTSCTRTSRQATPTSCAWARLSASATTPCSSPSPAATLLCAPASTCRIRTSFPLLRAQSRTGRIPPFPATSRTAISGAAARLTSKSRSSACWRPRNICSPAASPLPARRISPSETTRRPST